MIVQLYEQTMHLLPERAMWWPTQKALFIADIHFGKSNHFRKHGIPIPLDSHRFDETRLAQLIFRYKVERLIIAGDLFHSFQFDKTEAFCHFRRHHSCLHIDLIVGNHDLLGASSFEQMGLAWHKPFLHVDPFVIAHDQMQIPTDSLPKSQFLIHGHLHPGFCVRGSGRQSFTFPCFAIDDQRLVLPAFGSFTGMSVQRSRDWPRLYLIVDQEVILWK